MPSITEMIKVSVIKACMVGVKSSLLKEDP